MSSVGHDDFHVRHGVGEHLAVLVVQVVKFLDWFPVALEQVGAEAQVDHGPQNGDGADGEVDEAQADQRQHQHEGRRPHAVQAQVDQVPDCDSSLSDDVAGFARMHLSAL